LRQHIVRPRQREETALEGQSGFTKLLVSPKALSRNGLHCGERILHPMIQLVDESGLLLLGYLRFGDVHCAASVAEKMPHIVEPTNCIGAEPPDVARLIEHPHLASKWPLGS
jgi:hypothetical protein